MTQPRGWTESPVQPHDVPGYRDAVAAGLVRLPPDHPPRLAVQPSAAGRARRIVIGAVGALVVLLVALEALEGVLPQGWPAVAVTVVGGVVFVVTAVRWAGLGRTCIREFAHGYTTFEITYGTYWWGTGRSRPGNANRAPWDFSGLWRLEGTTGSVRRAPTGRSDPPGLYPSPHRPGSFELWSGVIWMNYFVDDPSTVRRV